MRDSRRSEHRGTYLFAKLTVRANVHTKCVVCASSPLLSLRPCLGQGASLGEEVVLADSGRAGIVADRAGPRGLALLGILRGCSSVVRDEGTVAFSLCAMVFPQPARMPGNGLKISPSSREIELI